MTKFDEWLREAQESGFAGTMADAQTRWELGQSADSFCRPSETEPERAVALELLREVSKLTAELVRLEAHLMSNRPHKEAIAWLWDAQSSVDSAATKISACFAPKRY